MLYEYYIALQPVREQRKENKSKNKIATLVYYIMYTRLCMPHKVSHPNLLLHAISFNRRTD